MKMNALVLGIVAVSVIFGAVLISSALGYWQTESSKSPAKISNGDFAGESDPADIRGSYSFGDIEAAFDIQASILAKAFGVSPETSDTFQLKSLETLYASLADQGVEIGTGSVKYFVSLYKGLPYELTEEVFLPLPAVELLINEGKVTEDQAKKLLEMAVEIPAFQTETSTTEVDSVPEQDPLESGFIIKGQTTFREVLEAGVSQEDIENIIGEKLPNPLTSIKSYCTEKGLNFETVKTALIILVDGQ
jgi:hypothetical protein